MKAYLVNKEILEKNDLDLEEYSSLLSIKEDIPFKIKEDVLNNLESKKFIKLKSNRIIFRHKTTEFFSSIKKDIDFLGKQTEIISKRTDREVNEEIKQRVQEYRNLFKDYKAGSMGSLTNCKTNLSKFLKENTQYTFDDIMKAARIYINSVNDLTYLQRADYFIYKQQKDKSIVSTLEAFIDETEDKANNDWTSNLK